MNQSPDAAEIRAVWDRACDALCSGDWDSYHELWATHDHVELLHPDEADWRIGWDSIGPEYRALVESGFRCRSETRTMRVNLSPSRNVAWATAEVVLHVADPPTERTTWQTLVFERIDGAWRLVHAHVSAAQPRDQQPAEGGRAPTRTTSEIDPIMERAIPHLPADDLRVARDFYVSRLGFEVLFEASVDGISGILGLQRGGIRLTIDSPMDGHGRNACVSLQVDDADAYFREWSARAPVLRAPRDEEWGARTFDLLDPFGNTLFVMGPVR